MRKTILQVLACSALLTGCEGAFGDLYDEVQDTQVDQRAVNVGHGTITIDATSYTEWQYVDLTADMLEVGALGVEDDEPENWTIALHRYDMKTNGGEAAETEYTSMSDLLNDPEWDIEKYEFTADVAGKITTDMSHMMEGYLVYSDTHVNEVVGHWLRVDTSTMPPIYTMNGNVFLIRTKEGEVLALRLVNYMNDASVKGHMTIEYHKLGATAER